MTLIDFHSALGRAVLLYSLAIGVYGLIIYFRRRTIPAGFWGTLALGEVLYLGQVAVGVALSLRVGFPQRSVHILYGVLPVIVLPAAYAFTRGRDDRNAALAYGLIGLFLAGVAIRAMTTA